MSIGTLRVVISFHTTRYGDQYGIILFVLVQRITKDHLLSLNKGMVPRGSVWDHLACLGVGDHGDHFVSYH